MQMLRLLPLCLSKAGGKKEDYHIRQRTNIAHIRDKMKDRYLI